MILLLIFLPGIIFAVKYDAELQNKEVFTPCSEYPDLSIDKIFDISNIKFITLENGSYHFTGKAVFNADPEDDKIKMNVDVFKKKRGIWVNTIYTIYRPDACTAVFSPTEIWYQFVTHIPEEQRKCPFRKGMQFSIDLIPNYSTNSPDRNLDGEYKIHFLYTYSSSNNVASCYDIDFTVYRV